jgi:hypothetical protein
MPAFAPRPNDLPSKIGLAVFAEPIAIYPAQEARRDDLVDTLATTRGGDQFRQLTEKIYDDQARTVAVSWGPTTNPRWRAGGLWMSFSAVTNRTADDVLAGKPAAAARARGMLPPLTVDNEAAPAWRPEGAPPEEFMLTGTADQHGTLSWARLVFAAFQLAAQGNLAETEQQPVPRSERRRTERAGLPPRDVRIVRLRRSVAAACDAEQDGVGHEWRHRWVVRGHWRCTLVSVNNSRLIFNDPKTRGSRAWIALSPRAGAALQRQRRRQSEQPTTTSRYDDLDLVFSRPDGQPLRPERTPPLPRPDRRRWPYRRSCRP